MGVVRSTLPPPHKVHSPVYNALGDRPWSEMCASSNACVLKHILSPRFYGYLDWDVLLANPHPIVLQFFKTYDDSWDQFESYMIIEP